MKIPNPTVLLKDGELFCLTGEVPKEPKFEQIFDSSKTLASRCREYNNALASAKSSAVKVKNEKDILDFIRANSELSIFKDGKLYTLTGYEAKSDKHCQHDSCPIEGACDHCANEVTLVTITPIKSESQEDLKEKIEFIKGAFQCYVGYEDTTGLVRFLDEAKFTIQTKTSLNP
jgi:hypothetical protein